MDQADAILAHASSQGRVYLWWIQALRKSGAGVTARDVLAVLASYADKKTGEAWPSIETIAATLGVRKNAVQVAIRQLKAAGILNVIPRNRRKRETNLYRFQVFNPDNVSDSNTQSPAQMADQVSKLRQNQVPGLCSNRVVNLPIEPNVRTLSEKNRDDEALRPLVALLERCGFNGQADSEARRVSTQYPGREANIAAWLRRALDEENGIRNPLGFAISKRDETPPSPRSQNSIYPTFEGVDADGNLVFTSAKASP